MKPVINITMPVFNRMELTQLSLLSLRKCSQQVPFTITVVDNGSEPQLAQRLVELKQAGVIDKLFLLDKNMGISCAANIGWEMTEALVYMKLDNDIVIKDPLFFSKIFALWRTVEPVSAIGPLFGDPANPEDFEGLRLCSTGVAGAATFIPKQVSDVLGMWSEDYGLYGAEDGDYGVRMKCAGFPQYLYNPQGYMEHLGDDSQKEYIPRGVDKGKERRNLFVDDSGKQGMFRVNHMLYDYCIRTLQPVRRYLVDDVGSDYKVRLKENEEFFGYKALLDKCSDRITAYYNKAMAEKGACSFSLPFIESLKKIMKSGGYSCDDMVANSLNKGNSM